MGNQLVGIAPSQIFPVEHYLTDIPDFQFDLSLGSTRFLKVARAKCKEGLVVVKVFAIHDPSLPLKSYKDKLEDIKSKLRSTHNQLPFQRFMLTDKAGLLLRQYVKDNLYDRISTRPFLNQIEKKWIAFQILHAISHCHKMGVCHGDIKLENIMVTGWNWVLLTDFASFKPTYLPEDNPADFSYFFDTSRRRTCYIAPERFVKTLNTEAIGTGGGNLLLPDDEIKEGDLTPSMDIFSIGCALTELFTEGHSPFDLSLLLSYRNGEYSPWKVLEKIDDPFFREMIRHMMQKDPSHRLTAEEYLQKLRLKFFPEYFYTFLRDYLQQYAGLPVITADEKISRLQLDLPLLMEVLCSKSEISEDGEPIQESLSEGLVIIVSFITSCLRALQQCSAKLQALSMLAEMTPHLNADIILDRLTPYMLYLVNDPFPRVRASAICTLTYCLTQVRNVPRSDANVFPEYILPYLAHLTQDEAVKVRMAFAENIAVLAETALRFLELTQLEANNNEQNDTAESCSTHYQASYDAELQALHEMIQQRVSILLSDPDNIIKRTLMENGITRLCVFFGHQKANDVLLSHMITFLNDKEDRNLRGTFFDCIVGIAAYIGWQSSSILKPLLQQGLSDTEEFIIVKALNAMTNLTELGLLQKLTLYELLAETAPLLCHPNLWIRQGTVGFVCTVAKSLNIADVHCKLQPVILPFLKNSIIQVNKEVILLSTLKDPIPRAVYDGIVRSAHIDGLLDSLQERHLLRGIARSGHQPNYGETDSIVRNLHRRLVSEGMTESEEEKLLLMRDCLLKIYKSRTSFDGKQALQKEQSGFIDLGNFSLITRRNADLTLERASLLPSNHSAASSGARLNRKRGARINAQEMPSVVMNEEWQHMFGTTATADVRSASPQLSQGEGSSLMTQSLPQSPARFAPVDEPRIYGNVNNTSTFQLQKEAISPRRLTGDQFIIPLQKQHIPAGSCQIELRELIRKKTEELHTDQVIKEASNGIVQEIKFPSPSWKPKGLLVAHLHEHHSSVNRVLAIPDSTLFVTCSNDGTVKIWDCGRMEGKSVANRSRQTFSRQEGQIVSIAVCQSCQSIASASDNCTINVFRYELGNAKMSIVNSRNLDPQEEGCVVDMQCMDSGSQSVLTYVTVYGSIMGWDLRSPGLAWKLENDLSHGLITSFCVDPHQTWLVVGTSSGNHVCWDIRFQLPISCHPHPIGARVRRLVLHSLQQSWVISAVQGNNEVSMWDMETGARQTTLWASSAPPLSHTQASNHSVNAIHTWPGEDTSYLLTAGSDMRIRYWDIHSPSNSYVVVGAASDLMNPSLVSYRSRLIDGTEVIQEIYNKPRTHTTEDMPRRGPDAPPTGHNDSISDLAICQTSQTFIISAAKNGVVKVWK